MQRYAVWGGEQWVSFCHTWSRRHSQHNSRIPAYFNAQLPACWRREAWSCSPLVSHLHTLTFTAQSHSSQCLLKNKVRKRSAKCTTITLHKKIMERETSIDWQCVGGGRWVLTFSSTNCFGFFLPFQFVITITLFKCRFSFQRGCGNFLENIF